MADKNYAKPKTREEMAAYMAAMDEANANVIKAANARKKAQATKKTAAKAPAKKTTTKK